MKIVIAPDSFKGSLTAVEAADAMACGVKRAVPDAEIVKIPLADGGEGTVDVLVASLGGVMCECDVKNPLGRRIKAEYGVVNVHGDKTAIIEVAAASGLTLIAETERDALHSTSYGTGELIKDALDRGCRSFIIGLGGSATTDAGKGLLEALGVKFYGENGELLEDGGVSLSLLSHIDTSGIDERVRECTFRVMCDVENPLYGEKGAAYVFSPQKGANPHGVEVLDKGLRQFASCVYSQLNIDVSQLSGGGAAGGIGAALVAFLGAKTESGAELVLTLTRFVERIEGVDFVLTGEGKMDRQTVMGKLLLHVLRKATECGVSVVAFAGKVENRDVLLNSGFKEIYCINSNSEIDQNVMNKTVASNNLADTVFYYMKSL